MAAFSTKRYLPCETGDLEDGFEKIAITLIVSTQTPKHAAQQFPLKRAPGGGDEKTGVGERRPDIQEIRSSSGMMIGGVFARKEGAAGSVSRAIGVRTDQGHAAG